MPTFRNIKKKLKAVSVIEVVAAAYQEISKKEMKKIREMTLKNRQFIEEVSKVYGEAKRAYFFQKEQEEKEGKTKKEKNLLKPKKKKAIIFFSANARFYGGLLLDVWLEVSDYLKKNKADLLVIGEVGKHIAENSALSNKIHYFKFDDEKPEENEIQEIINFIKDYQQIKIFHGKFKTVLSQEISQTDISGEVLEEKTEEVFAYLFEPSPQAVLDFFRTELITAFFTQAFLEHRLSRHATRMVQMYRTREKAKERKKKLQDQERKLKWQTLDRKQQEINLSSQSWR